MNYIAIPGIKDVYRSESAPVITPERIIETVCDYFDLPMESLKGKCRIKELVYARYVIFYFLRKYTSITFKSAGLMFNRDHTTVIHGLQHLSNIMETEPNVKSEVELLAIYIHGGN